MPAGEAHPPVSETSPAAHVSDVKEIFSTIVARYDFLNRFLSFRRDVAWRRFTARKMCFFKTGRFLDVATGTADLALETARKHPDIEIIGLDFVSEMMAVGKDKIKAAKLSPRIHLTQGNALELPFPDDYFDVAAVAFGIRNIPDHLAALREMRRVTVPGGQVMVLEMSTPQNALVKIGYKIYLTQILPRLARPFSRKPEAYHYLADSIINFPGPNEFAEVMKTASLSDIRIYPLTLGITYLHIGVKP